MIERKENIKAEEERIVYTQREPEVVCSPEFADGCTSAEQE